MYYYKFNIGDYASHTGYLSLMEDLAYRRLLDLYYLKEKPIPDDPEKVARLIGMRDYSVEISQVLGDFFILENNLWVNKRADGIIVEYHANADRARANGSKGGRPLKPRDNPVGFESKPSPNPEITESKAKQEPLNIKQEPLTTKHKTKNQKPSTIKTTTKTPLQILCGEVWKSYSDAYFNRYQTEPIRNGKVNTNIKQITERLGADAPPVASFFVSINDQFLIKQSHAIGSLLQNCEGYRTQWATGNQITSERARQIDRTQTNMSGAEEAIRMRRARNDNP